jgi:hypothetical protein
MSYHKHQISEIKEDGLRYSRKKNGSPFEGKGHTGEMMSCIKCGIHKPRATGSFRKILNTHHFYCGECRIVPAKSRAASD